MAEELLNRRDVPENLTWDLSLIYPSEEAMYEASDKVQEMCSDIEKRFKGRLNSPENICSCIDELHEIRCIMTLVMHYCDLAVSVDYYDSHNQERFSRINNICCDIDSRLSFIDSEITMQDESVIKAAIEKSQKGKHYLENIIRSKPHFLGSQTEKVLAALSPAINLPYQIYNITKLADMKFDSFTVDQKEYPLGYSLFEDDYEYDTRTDVRRAAFKAFSAKIKEYENVTAAAYDGQVHNEKILSRLRGFDSVFDSLLFDQKVTREMYDRQIDLITTRLAPHMQKYAKLIQKVHGLEEMTFADLKLPLDPEYDPKLSIEKAQEYAENALSILGEDYRQMVHTAFTQRWFDFAQNKGKSTGGFCASPYGRNSFILTTWNGRMADVFTIVHELGHAGNFKACNAAQSLFDTDVSSYFVEAPSTMNELLLTSYLLKNSSDLRFRRWVLANMISNTYYHNFVTHLMEAAYQRKVYRIIDEGGSVQADTLSSIMKETLTQFWGDAVSICDGAELTWMRQPHYYMGLYSYTYSAGLTIATQVSKRIEKEGQPAIDDWKKVLAAGSTLDSCGLAALAGIDITTDGPLLDTIETIGSIIDEICDLT